MVDIVGRGLELRILIIVRFNFSEQSGEKWIFLHFVSKIAVNNLVIFNFYLFYK